MAAGTVISGGFPGRVAQEVQPNPKCHGCLHYDGQGGRTGICTIGSKPWMCGDGDAQDIGYAPLTRGAGAYLPDMDNHAVQAREVETQFVSDLYGSGSTRPVHFQEVTLGQGHIPLIKSFYARHSDMQKMLCRLHQGNGQSYGMAAPSNFDAQVCSCSEPNARDVAKALVPTLSNRERTLLEFSDLVEFVEDVVRAGFNRIDKAVFPAGEHGKFVTHAGINHGKLGVAVMFHPKDGNEDVVHVARVDSHTKAKQIVDHHTKRMKEGGGPPQHGDPAIPAAHTPSATSENDTRPNKSPSAHPAGANPVRKPAITFSGARQPSGETGAHSVSVSKKPAITFSGARQPSGETGAHPVSVSKKPETPTRKVAHDSSDGVPQHIGKSAARLAKALAEIEKAGKTPEEQMGRPLPKPPKSSKKRVAAPDVAKGPSLDAHISEQKTVQHFKAPHGSYKIEHHPDHAIVHYKPKGGSSAPAQSAVMKDGDQAQKVAKVHAFVNDHSFGENGGGGHATLHEDHVKVHDGGGEKPRRISSMKQAREHLGY